MKLVVIWVIAEQNKTNDQENLFVAVSIVLTIVLGHPFNKRADFWLV